MQALTSKDGTKKRAFCLSCLNEGRQWIGGGLCEHLMGPSQEVAPQATLDPVSQRQDDPS